MKKSICICILALALLSGCVCQSRPLPDAVGDASVDHAVKELSSQNVGIQLQYPSLWLARETALLPQCVLNYDTDVQVSIDLLDEKIELDSFTEEYFAQMYRRYFTSWEDKEFGVPEEGRPYYSFVENVSNYKRTNTMVRMSCYVRTPLFDGNPSVRNYHYYTTYIVNIGDKYTLLIRCEEVDDRYEYLEQFDDVVSSIRYVCEPMAVSSAEGFDYWMKQGLIHGKTQKDVQVN